MKLAKFIRTESSPAIFWVPRLHSARTTGLVRITQDKIAGELPSIIPSLLYSLSSSLLHPPTGSCCLLLCEFIMFDSSFKRSFQICDINMVFIYVYFDICFD